MEVKYSTNLLDASTTLAALLDEFSAITDYRTLRDNLPRRLAGLLRCRCVLCYQRMGETLQFASGSFADQPGWSAALLAVAHINPIELTSEVPEARAWRARRAVLTARGGVEHAQICVPLIYRQRAIGVLTALREPGDSDTQDLPGWQEDEAALVAVVANVVAMLLENTRLLERDRERIHELSLLNSITSQMNYGLRDQARVQQIVIQRAREIALPDLCTVLTPASFSHSTAHETKAQTVSDVAPGWLVPPLQELLLGRWQSDLHAAPLVLERGSTRQASEYMQHLDTHIKTFFALPLISKRGAESTPARFPFATVMPRGREEAGGRVLGVLVGAYHKLWKLRREELMLLQILSNQASAVLENSLLMDEVIEARNEARRLLRKVLDDQRFKELILESIPSGLITIDLQGCVTTFNRAAASVLGYHPGEVMGRPVRKVLDLRTLERGFQTGQIQHETLLTSGRQGQELALEITLLPLRNERGEPVGMLATFADITSIYHLEEEKRRLDRLASLGEMSANVAHEVRNPLAAIKTSMQMLRDDLESKDTAQAESAQDEVAVVLKEVERLDGIVHDLLLFARPRQLHRVECQLGELCARLLHFLKPQCEERGVRVHLLQQEQPSVSIDVAQMEQVLMNIFLNALQAMPDGGTLSISAQILHTPVTQGTILPGRQFKRAGADIFSGATWDEQERQSAKFPDHRITRDQQAWLELAVSDTGAGIAQDALERIFQPFYTTKAHGIGLGLPITRRLIEDHHGHILVESQLGYGTTISIRLPLHTESVGESAEEEKDREPDDPDR